ncbi:hypothetical protein KY361_00570 [Candidatus Woesearchaeota archaeon]|nr:hypothetical protein [Candidatus Woesearchaeota archaeon]
MKCEICKKKIEETFLKKVVGTYIKKPGSNKKYLVCPECQKKLPKKEDLLKQLK